MGPVGEDSHGILEEVLLIEVGEVDDFGHSMKNAQNAVYLGLAGLTQSAAHKLDCFEIGERSLENAHYNLY